MLLSPTIPKMENNFHVRLCGFISTTNIVTYGWKVAFPTRRKKFLWQFPNISFTLHFTFFINLFFPSSSLIFLLFTGHLVFNSIWNIKLNQLRKPFSGWKCRHNLTETCYKQLQKYLRPHLGLNGISMILCSQSPVPSPAQSKMLTIPDHAQSVEEQLWMHGRKWGGGRYVISQRCVTSRKATRLITEATLNKCFFFFPKIILDIVVL